MYCTDYNDLIITYLYCIRFVGFVFLFISSNRFSRRFLKYKSATHSQYLTTNLKYKQRILLILHEY